MPFGCIEQSRRALTAGCQRAAHALIPLGGYDESIAARYGRAAAHWPDARHGAGPSRERQAQLLGSLDDAGAALRAAAEHCARARYLLATTIDASAGADLEHSSGAPGAA